MCIRDSRKGVRMYDKRAKQDALDLWFSMPGEMSVDDFAAELGLSLIHL